MGKSAKAFGGPGELLIRVRIPNSIWISTP
jgi:hypothetical protein